MADLMEQTVKATIDSHTKAIKSFVWLKERNGDLHLTFDECQQIACCFIATYYASYMPYIQIVREEPSFNAANHAFFSFPIVLNDVRMEAELFMIGVNETTGLVDVLMTPTVSVEMIEAFIAGTPLPLNEALQAVKKLDLKLSWDVEETINKVIDIPQYRLCEHQTKRTVRGLNALTGELILWND